MESVGQIAAIILFLAAIASPTIALVAFLISNRKNKDNTLTDQVKHSVEISMLLRELRNDTGEIKSDVKGLSSKVDELSQRVAITEANLKEHKRSIWGRMELVQKFVGLDRESIYLGETKDEN